MTEQEKINVDVQRQIDAQGARIDTLVIKVDALSDKIDAFVNESRAARERQDADIREMRQKHDEDIKEMNQRFYAKFDAIDAKFDKMDAKIDNIGSHVRNLSVATIIGVATIAITVIYSILTR